MDKKNKNISKNKGFTLIELLTVLSIIMILSAIAIPFFLGQRDKARASAIVASAKGSVSEIQSWLDAFITDGPFIAIDSNRVMTCFESNSVNTREKCSLIFPTFPQNHYESGNLSSLINIILAHHLAKAEKSPFNGSQDLFVGTTGIGGTIVISGVGDKIIQITAFGAGTSSVIFSDIITGR
jgi:prepilin-type N-terminal cleavage/methylation domain-containing protein